MTVKEYLDGRNAYATASRGSVGAAAREAYASQLKQQYVTQLKSSGLSIADASAQATSRVASEMSTLAALHSPDMIAGGANVISGMGDTRVNSAIGAGWTSKLSGLDEAALKVPPGVRGTTRMNTKLARCK